MSHYKNYIWNTQYPSLFQLLKLNSSSFQSDCEPWWTFAPQRESLFQYSLFYRLEPICMSMNASAGWMRSSSRNSSLVLLKCFGNSGHYTVVSVFTTCLLWRHFSIIAFSALNLKMKRGKRVLKFGHILCTEPIKRASTQHASLDLLCYCSLNLSFLFFI